jgi:hypothetical protein
MNDFGSGKSTEKAFPFGFGVSGLLFIALIPVEALYVKKTCGDG